LTQLDTVMTGAMQLVSSRLVAGHRAWQSLSLAQVVVPQILTLKVSLAPGLCWKNCRPSTVKKINTVR